MDIERFSELAVIPLQVIFAAFLLITLAPFAALGWIIKKILAKFGVVCWD